MPLQMTSRQKMDMAFSAPKTVAMALVTKDWSAWDQSHEGGDSGSGSMYSKLNDGELGTMHSLHQKIASPEAAETGKEIQFRKEAKAKALQIAIDKSKADALAWAAHPAKTISDAVASRHPKLAVSAFTPNNVDGTHSHYVHLRKGPTESQDYYSTGKDTAKNYADDFNKSMAAGGHPYRVDSIMARGGGTFAMRVHDKGGMGKIAQVSKSEASAIVVKKYDPKNAAKSDYATAGSIDPSCLSDDDLDKAVNLHHKMGMDSEHPIMRALSNEQSRRNERSAASGDTMYRMADATAKVAARGELDTPDSMKKKLVMSQVGDSPSQYAVKHNGDVIGRVVHQDGAFGGDKGWMAAHHMTGESSGLYDKMDDAKSAIASMHCDHCNKQKVIDEMLSKKGEIVVTAPNRVDPSDNEDDDGKADDKDGLKSPQGYGDIMRRNNPAVKLRTPEPMTEVGI